MNRRRVFLYLAAASAFILWIGALTFYYAYTKKINVVLYISIALAVLGVAGIITFCILAAFAGKSSLKQLWYKLLNESYKYANNPQWKIDYKACLEKVRGNYLADTDKYKNRLEKASVNNEKRFLDFSVLETGSIYYGSIIRANEDLVLNSSRFIHQTLPAVVVYSPDEYFLNNPKKLNDIADRADKNGLFADKHKDLINVKISTELTGNREVYATDIMVCRRQLPFGYLSGRIVPLIANPAASPSAFIVDCKYWTGEFAHIHFDDFKPEDSEDYPFDI